MIWAKLLIFNLQPTPLKGETALFGGCGTGPLSLAFEVLLLVSSLVSCQF